MFSSSAAFAGNVGLYTAASHDAGAKHTAGMQGFWIECRSCYSRRLKPLCTWVLKVVVQEAQTGNCTIWRDYVHVGAFI